LARFRSSFVRSAILALVSLAAAVGMVAAPLSSQAVATLDSGSAAGGTAVTIEGIHFVQVAGGDHHTVGLTSQGTVYAWGNNDSGQLGDGTTGTNRTTPVQVLGVSGSGFLTRVTSIAAGYDHSMALTPDGVFTWGSNGAGQLGDNTTLSKSRPVQVLGLTGTGFLSGVTSIAAGGSHSLAVSEGGLFTWGKNDRGQLGIYTGGDRMLPMHVVGVGGTGFLSGVTSIAAGNSHSLALTDSGVYTWGKQNDTSYFSSPFLVSGVTGATSIAAGYSHSLALTAAGVYAWGDNSAGQLGDGTTTARASESPAHVMGVGGSGFLTGVTSLAGGYAHSLALSPSGVYAWGINGNGQLGDNTTTNESHPVHVLGLTGATSIASGLGHSLAVNPTGVYAWGDNARGQLGSGTTTGSSTPALSANFQPFAATFAGVAATQLSNANNIWTATTPAGDEGTAEILATASLFGGTTAATPATVTWSAGTFTYNAATLAATGLSPTTLPIGVAVLALGLGLLTITTHRRRTKQQR
jgi:alpha-tubulin suppressor-like RCC1 family protein